MKGQIKIRYRLHCEDWAEEVCFYDSEDAWPARGVRELLGSILNKRSNKVALDKVHMVMEQATFNQLAYQCALECVHIGESFEMMTEFDILWLGGRYTPVYLQFPKESVPEEPAPSTPDDPMIMF